MPLSHERVKEALRYDPATGLFTWLTGKTAGKRAGGKPDKEGYHRVFLDGKLYRAGRLAWFYMTGEWPETIDHINRRPGDDSWANLREASPAQQCANRGARFDSSTGLKGVRTYPNSKKFYVLFQADGEQRRVGRGFDTAEEAHAAYLQMARQVHGHFADAQTS